MFFLISGFIAIMVFFILFTPVMLVLFAFRKKHPYGVQKVAQHIVRNAFKVIIFFSGQKLVVIGTERVPKEKASMFASNHRGIFEAAMAYATLPVNCGIVSKKELRKVTWLAFWMDLCMCFFLDRDSGRSGVNMLLNSIEHIKNGLSVFICPEGTRSKIPGMLPFQEPSFKIASKTGCPIIPVACSGADDVFENHKPWFRHNTLVIEYGEPIYLENLTEEERKTPGAYTQAIIGKMLEAHEPLIKNNWSRKRARKNIG